MMKKIVTILFCFVCVILESTLFGQLRIGGILPNITLILTLSIALTDGSRWGRNLGFFMGLTQDVLFTPVIGYHALLYFLLGHIGGYGHRVLRKGNLLIPLMLILLGDVVYGFVNFLFRAFLLGRTDLSFYLRSVILPEAAYTAFFVLPLYCLIAWGGRLLSNMQIKKMVTWKPGHHERMPS